MSQQIFVVTGRCGKGNFKAQWLVIAYLDQAQAEAHAINANAAADLFYDQNAGEENYTPVIVKTQYDPHMQTDILTRTRYKVQVVPLG